MGMEARHVLVVVKHEGKWLVTRHSNRGIEFPGGKAEDGETIFDAAIRETIEETGVTISDLVKFAEYVVISNVTFCKAVFTGKVSSIEENPQLFETEGALWMTDEELDNCDELSFHMKDAGMAEIRKWVNAYAS
ncbi:NUDIX domain-containing protein [Sporosarcina koreensis]|uniref:NUDIX domain-containing protein n=1 Tax=Sporosarcina koreensis TaxID=334735 RepID=A0ABW0TV30_9BACL